MGVYVAGRIEGFGEISVSFPDISGDLKSAMPDLRGRLLANESLAPLTWFRVGGPAQVLFTPEDESDLAYALANLAKDIPVTVVGLGSNLIVRDGGVPVVVIRLGRGFGEVTAEPDHPVRPSRMTTPGTPPSRTIRFEPSPTTVTGISDGSFFRK